MNYDVVRIGAKNAVKYLNINPEKYSEAMKVFYTEGKKNPSVARIIMQDEIRLGAAESLKTQAALSDAFDVFEKTCQKTSYSVTDEAALMHKKNNIESILGVNNNNSIKISDDPFSALYNINKLKKVYFSKLLDSLHILGKKSPKEAELVKADFDNSFSQLYPKTKNIRENIAKYNMRMQKTTPLLNHKEKRMLLLEPEKGWLSLYPKSLYKRSELLKGKKTGFIEKLSYLFVNEKKSIAKDLVDFELLKSNKMFCP